MSDREPIDAEFVEVTNVVSSPWPRGWPEELRALPRCATCETFAYGGAREQIPIAVAGVRHHPSCPRLRSMDANRPTVATTAGDKARGVSALLAAGAGVLAEGSRAAGEIATGADEVERGLNRAKDAGERFGGAVARVGDALKRMGVIGRTERAPTMAGTRGEQQKKASGR